MRRTMLLLRRSTSGMASLTRLDGRDRPARAVDHRPEVGRDPHDHDQHRIVLALAAREHVDHTARLDDDLAEVVIGGWHTVRGLEQLLDAADVRALEDVAGRGRYQLEPLHGLTAGLDPDEKAGLGVDPARGDAFGVALHDVGECFIQGHRTSGLARAHSRGSSVASAQGTAPHARADARSAILARLTGRAARRLARLPVVESVA